MKDINYESNSRTNFSSISWLLFGFIGLIYAVTSNPDNSKLGLWIFIWVISGIFWGWILGLIIDSISISKPVKAVGNEIKKIKEHNIEIKETKKSLSKYKDAQQRYQFLSKDTLLRKYENYQADKVSNMEKLAIEEELVRRGIIEYSPMHEKLEKIRGSKDNFSRINKDERMHSVNLLANKLSCSVDKVKQSYFSQLSEDNLSSFSLIEIEFKWKKQAAAESNKLNISKSNTPSAILAEWTKEFRIRK